jgi:ABC transport system ATP-binding/permease protein
LEEALVAFPGVVLVVSHDRYFLNRVCTDILAFEGDGRIAHSVGDYDYYLEKRKRVAEQAKAWESKAKGATKPSAAPVKTAKPRKLSFKETRELEGMEAQIQSMEAEIARIEKLFASPDFHRTHATQTNELNGQLADAKENLTKLFARWEELEGIRLASVSPPAD